MINTRHDSETLKRAVAGMTVCIEQATNGRAGWECEKLPWFRAHLPTSRNTLAQGDTAEELQAWALKLGAKRAVIL